MKSLKIIKQYIILTTTLFIVLLQPLHSFQHYYNEVLSECSSHDHKKHTTDEHNQNHEDDCPICDFTYQPYVATDTFSFEPFSFSKLTKPYVYQTSEYISESLFHNYLRGPPAQFLV